MFAGILTGMQAQKEKNTVNRRESSKLFQDYLKSNQELGIDASQEDLENTWDSFSSFQNLRHTPTANTMQSIIAAGKKKIQSQADLEAHEQFTRDEVVSERVQKDLRNMFISSGAPDTGDFSSFYDDLQEGYQGSPVLLSALDQYTNSGKNISGQFLTYQEGETKTAIGELETAIASGQTDAKSLKDRFPQVDPLVIDQMISRAGREDNYLLTTREREQVKFEQEVEKFDQGVVTFNNQQIMFDRATVEHIDMVARREVERSQKDRVFDLNDEMTIEKIEQTKRDIIRNIVLQAQQDEEFDEGRKVFAQNETKFNSDMQKRVTDAARLLVTQATTDAAAATTQAAADNVYAQQNARNVGLAAERVLKSIENGSYTEASARQAAVDFNVSPDTIDQFVQSQNQVFNTAVSTRNSAFNDKRSTQITSWNQENKTTIEQLKTDTNQNLIKNFEGAPENISGAIMNLANRYYLESNFVQTKMVDYVLGELNSGKYEGKSQSEINQSIGSWLDSNNAMTYTGMARTNESEYLKVIGPEQMTPEQMKTNYMPELSGDIETMMLGMRNAANNQNYEGYLLYTTALTALLTDVNNLSQMRQKNYAKYYGINTSQAEADEIANSIEKLIKDTQGRQSMVSKPAQQTTSANSKFLAKPQGAAITNTNSANVKLDDLIQASASSPVAQNNSRTPQKDWSMVKANLLKAGTDKMQANKAIQALEKDQDYMDAMRLNNVKSPKILEMRKLKSLLQNANQTIQSIYTDVENAQDDQNSALQ